MRHRLRDKRSPMRTPMLCFYQRFAEAVSMLRWILAVMLSGAACAQAELDCKQVGGVILATLDYRDQGYSLPTVITMLDQVRSADKLSEVELAYLRMVVRHSFLQASSPKDILEDCEDRKKAEKGEKPRKR
jgi:hypothetical protein